MATTTNFNWETPDDTDLVKDGAAAIRTLGSSIDTSFVDLKGGTTGQVLAKASGTDLDFSWVAQDDSNAIQNAIVDAKGDLIAATAADTPARLAVGTNGQILTADSTAATGLAWVTPLSTASALVLIHTETLSGVSAVNIDSKFTSTYANYLILANIEQSTSNVHQIQYRSAGSTITSGYKTSFWYTEYTTNVWNTQSSSSDDDFYSVSSNTDRKLMTMVVGDPQVSEFTKAQILSTDNTYNVGYNSIYPQVTAIDGIRMSVNTGTMTGTVRIYGYQNS
ncbi:hypothetical protein UFOVP796_17 [uncultured Caudovirales phage]|uniref:Uncharacterized protein n=1 Tax=uncultured Caudovirales phage TaxID=2100421 RepID=A0A6J5NVA9_9CAUD|nr:hypothetical protein UFOVP796_17 [uncultured Caudovirales phage]